MILSPLSVAALYFDLRGNQYAVFQLSAALLRRKSQRE